MIFKEFIRSKAPYILAIGLAGSAIWGLQGIDFESKIVNYISGLALTVVVLVVYDHIHTVRSREEKKE